MERFTKENARFFFTGGRSISIFVISDPMLLISLPMIESVLCGRYSCHMLLRYF
jgi:hypothetical protein